MTLVPPFAFRPAKVGGQTGLKPCLGLEANQKRFLESEMAQAELALPQSPRDVVGDLCIARFLRYCGGKVSEATWQAKFHGMIEGCSSNHLTHLHSFGGSDWRCQSIISRNNIDS